MRANLNISARCRNCCRYSLIPQILASPHDRREELLLALLVGVGSSAPSIHIDGGNQLDVVVIPSEVPPVVRVHSTIFAACSIQSRSRRWLGLISSHGPDCEAEYSQEILAAAAVHRAAMLDS